MKILLKIVFLFVSIFFAGQAKAVGTGEGTGNNSDTTSSLKSNIVIFKMLTTVPAASGNGNGSLKKAGKVARTSSQTSTKGPLSSNEG